MIYVDTFGDNRLILGILLCRHVSDLRHLLVSFLYRGMEKTQLL